MVGAQDAVIGSHHQVSDFEQSFIMVSVGFK
jgi:hypothetical protein